MWAAVSKKETATRTTVAEKKKAAGRTVAAAAAAVAAATSCCKLHATHVWSKEKSLCAMPFTTSPLEIRPCGTTTPTAMMQVRSTQSLHSAELISQIASILFVESGKCSLLFFSQSECRADEKSLKNGTQQPCSCLGKLSFGRILV